LAIRGLKAMLSPKDHMDPARAVTCSRSPDDHVVAAVVIQIGQSDGGSKLIARDALAETGSLLVHDVARRCGEP
jgi:hypothetical protein